MADLVRMISQSNLPRHAKSNLFSEFISKSGDSYSAALARVGAHGVATAHVARQYGEAGITGIALAALAVHLPTGLDIAGKAPIDLGVALLGAGVAIGMPHNEAAVDARNVGAVAGGIYAFRQSGKFFATKAKANGQKIGGTFAGDDDSEWSNPSLSGEAGAVGDPLVELASRL